MTAIRISKRVAEGNPPFSIRLVNKQWQTVMWLDGYSDLVEVFMTAASFIDRDDISDILIFN